MSGGTGATAAAALAPVTVAAAQAVHKSDMAGWVILAVLAAIVIWAIWRRIG